MAKDPVCGMNVDEKTAKYKSEHMGKTYYFCNQACKTTFDENPMEYMGTGRQSGHSGHSGHHGCCC
ncbi:MAG: YHS domain-containing protein [Candidatus Freyarchaeum deiterrae]